MVKSSQVTDTVKLKERREKNHTAVLGTGHLHNMEPAEKKQFVGKGWKGITMSVLFNTLQQREVFSLTSAQEKKCEVEPLSSEKLRPDNLRLTNQQRNKVTCIQVML